MPDQTHKTIPSLTNTQNSRNKSRAHLAGACGPCKLHRACNRVILRQGNTAGIRLSVDRPLYVSSSCGCRGAPPYTQEVVICAGLPKRSLSSWPR